MNEYQDSLVKKMSNMSEDTQKELLSKNVELKRKQIKELKQTRMATRVAFVIVLLMNVFAFTELMLFSTTVVKISAIVNVVCLTAVSYLLGANTKYRDSVNELNFEVNAEENLLSEMNKDRKED